MREPELDDLDCNLTPCHAVCEICGYEWGAMVAGEPDALECPNCHAMAGDYEEIEL